MDFDTRKLKEAQDGYRQLYHGTTPAKKTSWWFRISKKRWFRDWQGLTPTQKTVLMTLWLYAGSKTFCFPAMRTMAKDLNCGRATINRSIKELEKSGFLMKEKVKNQRGRYNKYWLLR